MIDLFKDWRSKPAKLAFVIATESGEYYAIDQSCFDFDNTVMSHETVEVAAQRVLTSLSDSLQSTYKIVALFDSEATLHCVIWFPGEDFSLDDWQGKVIDATSGILHHAHEQVIVDELALPK